MIVLHVAQNSDGIEEVILLANRIDKTNSLAAIERNGEVNYTGGYLFNNTSEIKAIFATIPKEKHYKFAQSLKDDPFAKSYYDTKRVKEQEEAYYR